MRMQFPVSSRGALFPSTSSESPGGFKCKGGFQKEQVLGIMTRTPGPPNFEKIPALWRQILLHPAPSSAGYDVNMRRLEPHPKELIVNPFNRSHARENRRHPRRRTQRCHRSWPGCGLSQKFEMSIHGSTSPRGALTVSLWLRAFVRPLRPPIRFQTLYRATASEDRSS